MDVELVLEKLKTNGIQLKLLDGSLKIQGKLTDEDKDLIKQFKDEIIVRLTAEQEESRVMSEKIDAMLENKGYAYLFSKLLGEKLIIADTEMTAKQLSEDSDLVIYTMDELSVLCKDKSFTLEGLKRIHEAKKLFGGNIVDNADLEIKKSP